MQLLVVVALEKHCVLTFIGMIVGAPSTDARRERFHVRVYEEERHCNNPHTEEQTEQKTGLCLICTENYLLAMFGRFVNYTSDGNDDARASI